MLRGSAAAENIVQDAWLHFANTDHFAVTRVGAFLARIVTPLCLDEMKSTRARRELYGRSWLPEPILEPYEPGIDTAELTVTLMPALERLPAPIVGMDHVLRMYGGLHRKHGPDWTQFIRTARIDGLPGYVSRERGAILRTTAFATENGKIRAIYMMRNPDKLNHVDG